MKYIYEVYDDNKGQLWIFALDDERNVVWGAKEDGYNNTLPSTLPSNWWELVFEEGCDLVEANCGFGLFDDLNEATKAYKTLSKAAEEHRNGVVCFSSTKWW